MKGGKFGMFNALKPGPLRTMTVNIKRPRVRSGVSFGRNRPRGTGMTGKYGVRLGSRGMKLGG